MDFDKALCIKVLDISGENDESESLDEQLPSVDRGVSTIFSIENITHTTELAAGKLPRTISQTVLILPMLTLISRILEQKVEVFVVILHARATARATLFTQNLYTFDGFQKFTGEITDSIRMMRKKRKTVFVVLKNEETKECHVRDAIGGSRPFACPK